MVMVVVMTGNGCEMLLARSREGASRGLEYQVHVICNMGHDDMTDQVQRFRES